ncbi:MAG: hypothetical protein ACREQ9_02530, partial [Candidatus Binatia bacterium]
EGGLDRTVAPESGALLETTLGSMEKRRIRFPSSAHILTEEPNAPQVVAAVDAFFREAIGA